MSEESTRPAVKMESGLKGGANVGHGHVYPRADGSKARCGGPAICPDCAKDYARLHGMPLKPETTEGEIAPNVVAPAGWRQFVEAQDCQCDDVKCTRCQLLDDGKPGSSGSPINYNIGKRGEVLKRYLPRKAYGLSDIVYILKEMDKADAIDGWTRVEDGTLDTVLGEAQ